MGIISISTTGSFGHKMKSFSAQEHGHAQAIADALEWMAKEVLPEAVANDHRCHNDGISPSVGYGRVDKAPRVRGGGGE